MKILLSLVVVSLLFVSCGDSKVVTPSGTHVSFTPSAASSVAAGSSQAFTVTADSGYTLSSTVEGSCPAGSWSGNTYTTGAITSDCTVIFAASAGATAQTYTVTPSGTNVTISPSSAQTVTSGSTQDFSVTANSGYSLSATVGGTCAGGAWASSTYTTGAITADCTVTFSASLITKKMFVKATTSRGQDIGGISAADTACGTDANKPSGGGTYKALLVDGSNRIACTTADCSGGVSEHTNWVLAASTTYTRSDGTVIGTTTSNGIFTFPLTNAVDTSAASLWTGLADNWTTTNDCGDWAVGGGGAIGSKNATGSTAIYTNVVSCNGLYAYICVEQ